MPLIGPIPGLEEAIEAEHLDRLLPFTVCPERICGVEVQPLTPQLALELDAAGSPFMTGADLSVGAIAAFLWHVSTQRLAPKPWHLTQRRWERINYRGFLGMLWPMDAIQLAKGIRDYIEEASADGPGGGEGGPPPFASWASGIVDVIASRYGWAEKEILNTPFKRVWQYWRRSIRANDPKAIFINLKSHKVRADFAATLQGKFEEPQEPETSFQI